MVSKKKKKALDTLKPTTRLMAFLLCLISPEDYLQFSLGQQDSAIVADNIDLPVIEVAGFMFKGLPFLMKRYEKVVANWPSKVLLGRNHRILFGYCALLFTEHIMTCLSV